MKSVRNIAAILILVVVVVVIVVKMASREAGKAEANKNVCIANLGMLNCATALWSVDNVKTTNGTPVMADLAKYLKKIPECPSGGTYTLNRVGANSTCSIKGHELEQQRATPIFSNRNSSSTINQLPPLNAH